MDKTIARNKNRNAMANGVTLITEVLRRLDGKRGNAAVDVAGVAAAKINEAVERNGGLS